LDEVEVTGQKGQKKGKSLWQIHAKLMCGSIPEVVHRNTFDRTHQRWSHNVQMSYSDIARVRESPADDASVDTTHVSNLFHQDDTKISGLSVVTCISIMMRRMEEIDKQREQFTTKQQWLDNSISSVTSSVAKLTTDILAVRVDIHKISYKLEHDFNQTSAILATTHASKATASPLRNISRTTNRSTVKPTPPGK
jgi:hypothetical protein